MKVIAATTCLQDGNGLDLPPREMEDLGGAPVLLRSVERMLRCPRISEVYLLPPPARAAQLRGVPWPERCRILPMDPTKVRLRSVLRRLRRWTPANWRGGLFHTTVFCEELDMTALHKAVRNANADAAIWFSGSAPLSDPELAGAMIDYVEKHATPPLFAVSGAPPGFALALFRTGALETLPSGNTTLRDVFESWRVHKEATTEPTGQPYFYHYTPALHAPLIRLTADTARGLTLLRRLHERLGEGLFALPMQGIHAELRESPETYRHPYPMDVEVEVTGAVPNKLRTRPGWGDVRTTEFLDPDLLRRFLESFAGADDLRVTLGGWGDPLEHPRAEEILGAIGDAPVLGRHLVTFGANLTPQRQEAIMAANLDAVTVLLDAHTPRTHAALGGRDYELILQNLVGLVDLRRKARSPFPIIIPEIVRTLETDPEVEAFFDDWSAQGEWPVVRGYDHLAGRAEDLALYPQTPSPRQPCRRLTEEIFVRADGLLAACRQHALGDLAIGHIASDGAAAWDADAGRTLRAAHDSGAFPDLCGGCRDWF